MSDAHTEWAYLRGGLLAVAALLAAALVVWGIETVRYVDRAFAETTRCLRDEKGAAIEPTRDPIALSAELGALDTLIETNRVTVSVSSSPAGAERIAAAYRSVGGDLGPRLELRGRTVYLWERSPSPTQRQTLFDCTY
jgi:hypothetical protein